MKTTLLLAIKKWQEAIVFMKTNENY